jgi:hypothetical protein
MRWVAALVVAGVTATASSAGAEPGEGRPWRQWRGFGLDVTVVDDRSSLTAQGDLGIRVGPMWLRGGLGWGVGGRDHAERRDAASVLRATGVASLPVPIGDTGLAPSLDLGVALGRIDWRPGPTELVPEASLGVSWGFAHGYFWLVRCAATVSPVTAPELTACRGRCPPSTSQLAVGFIVEWRVAWTR